MNAAVTTVSPFAGLKDAKSFESGNFYPPGVYKVQIENIFLKETRKSGTCLIVELKTLESSNPLAPIGGKGTWLQKMLDKDIAFGAIKDFAIAVLGFDAKTDKEAIEKEVIPQIEQFMTEAVSKQTLKGQTVALEVTLKDTQKGGKFSKHTWSASAE